MPLISLSGFTAPKRRPKAYKASDAAYMVGGNPGYYIAARPRDYPMTPQQKKVKSIAHACGISKGIKKAALQLKMKNCVGPKFRGEEVKKGKGESESE